MEEYVEQDDEDVEEDTNEDALAKFSLMILKKQILCGYFQIVWGRRVR